jgi:outer membrane protein OmpA-like peptidoglycan-associated protein
MNILFEYQAESIIKKLFNMAKVLKSYLRDSILNYYGLLLALTLIIFITPSVTCAQGTIGNAIKNKVEQKIIEKAEDGVDEAFDQNNETNEDSEVNETESESNTEEETATEPIKQNAPVKQKIETKTQYDFVPGDVVLFYEDFSQDAIGDFPALWTGTGSGEVKTVNVAPGNWFHMNATDQVYNLMKDLNLPENFIMEFDIISMPKAEDEHFSCYLTLFNSTGEFLDDVLFPGTGGVHVTLSDDNWNVQGYNNDKENMLDGETTIAPVGENELSHVIIWVQKARMRIYHKGLKVIDLPTVMYTPTNYNRLRFSLWSQTGTPLISNLRFTTASPDTRSKLLTEGKLVSYGIYFDVNSDKIKSESKGAINDIAKVLNENPDVRIRIDGHTDSDGDEAKNLDLSKRRAASVKAMLESDFAVKSGRIETSGFGESKPVSSNATSEGKAKNRRVEFIKL